jgi:ABC-2 type transport system permease protein
MIASIKSELRKIQRRPAFLIAAGLIAGIVVLVYAVNYYQGWHPSSGHQAQANALLASLYPEQLVPNIIGAAFPLGAAMAIVLGALLTGSEYSWGTMKTVLTQGPGRLTTTAGRVVAFEIYMVVWTIILFAVGAVCSFIVASVDSHVSVWPAAIDIAKGMGATLLLLACYGAMGMAFGFLFRQAAVALGVALVYFLMLEQIVVRFLDGFNNGQYSWLADWTDAQNAQSLIESFTTTLLGRPVTPAVTADHALLVLAVYVVALLGAGGLMLQRRDVA